MMAKATKILLTTALTLMALGVTVFIIVLAVNGWKFYSEANLAVITKDFEDEISSITVSSDTVDVLLAPSEDGSKKVVLRINKDASYDASLTDGVLSVSTLHEKKWYEYINLGFYSSSLITVYLPEGDYEKLVISEHTGDITVSDKFIFESITISASTSDITCGASAIEDISITVNTGDLYLTSASARSAFLTTSTGDITAAGLTCSEELSLKVSTGDIYLADTACKRLITEGSTGDFVARNISAAESLSLARSTGDTEIFDCRIGTLEAEVGTGDIKIKKICAESIGIRTTTGDVELSLVDEMILSLDTSSGDINAVRGICGGLCEITTGSGDITVEYYN